MLPIKTRLGRKVTILRILGAKFSNCQIRKCLSRVFISCYSFSELVIIIIQHLFYTFHTYPETRFFWKEEKSSFSLKTLFILIQFLYHWRHKYWRIFYFIGLRLELSWFVKCWIWFFVGNELKSEVYFEKSEPLLAISLSQHYLQLQLIVSCFLCTGNYCQ